MTEPRRPRCTALTRAGDQCSKPAAPGRDVCKVHAGETKTGRPLKLTAKVIDKVAKALRDGAYRDQAATLAGIGKTSLYSYLERGEADLEAGTASVFADLVNAVTRAEAEAEERAIRAIRRHGSTDWRAMAWFLERKYPARWGRRLEVRHDGEVSVGKPRVVTPDGEERREAIASILRDAGALDSSTPTEEDPDGT